MSPLKASIFALAILGVPALSAAASPSPTGGPLPQPKLGPGVTVKDLQVKPLGKHAKIQLLEKAGINIGPTDLRAPVEITPGRLFHSRNAFANLWSTSLVNAGASPQVALMGSRGGIELQFRAAPDHAYVLDCYGKEGQKATAWIGDGGQGSKVEQTLVEGHFTHAFPSRNHARVVKMTISVPNWKWNACSITPAAL